MDWQETLLHEIRQLMGHDTIRTEVECMLTPIANQVLESALKNEEYKRDVERMLTPIWDKLHNLAYLFLATTLINIVLTCIVLVKVVNKRS